jgi:hypothetical protein
MRLQNRITKEFAAHDKPDLSLVQYYPTVCRFVSLSVQGSALATAGRALPIILMWRLFQNHFY